MNKHNWSRFLAAAAATFAAVAASATPVGVTVNGIPLDSGGSYGAGWSYDPDSSTLFLFGTEPFTLSGMNKSGGVCVVVMGGTTNTVTLSNLTLRAAGTNQCAFALGTGANVSLFLAGENTLASGYYRAGLEVAAGRTLSITNASGDDAAALAVTGGGYGAGIGGGSYGTGGAVTINGGTVTATGGYSGAGIGGGGAGGDGGTVSVNGGTVSANGGYGGAGIGGGGGGFSTSGGDGGTATFTGGSVAAIGGASAAGIGGGYLGGGGTVTVNGGEVSANGGDLSASIGGHGGAGIGGGASGTGGVVTVSGGIVTATGGDDGAGIGGGRNGAGGTVEISGGTVFANGGGEDENFTGGAGIGGGAGSMGGEVLISGGTITATGGNRGAGIGGGNGGGGGTVTVNDGIVEAYGGNYAAGIGGGIEGTGSAVAINGGAVSATGGEGGAGIGGGEYGAGGMVTVTGGVVAATGGDSGAGIGGGKEGEGGTVTVTGGAVTAKGGEYGAGIGGGDQGDGGTVTVNGGTVSATGGYGGAGIGGGASGGAVGTVTVSGGTVFAQGAGDGSDIGPGDYGAASGINLFTGGTIRLANSLVSPKPSNGMNHPVACAVVTGFEPDAPVTFGTPAAGLPDYYGTDGIFADAVGCIYLWLPDGDYTFTANGRTCTVKVKDGVGPTGVTVNGEEVAFRPAGSPGWNFDTTKRTLGLSGEGPFTLSGANVIGGVRVAVYSGTLKTAAVTLSNLTLRTAGADQCAFELGLFSRVSLRLAGTNALASGMFRAGLEVVGGRMLSITNVPGDNTALLVATGGRFGAGIGGGYGGTNGTIVVKGGAIMATGCDGGAGIGGGDNGAGGTITVKGGAVTATGGDAAAGIGGGLKGDGGTITVEGGAVTATGGDGGAGIGGGRFGAGGTIDISGGALTATGGDNGGAGIGGGRDSAGGTVTISGGSLTATGGDYAAGVGGGRGGAGGTFEISGGTITATGGVYGGAGIGGGREGVGGAFAISGGTITAMGGYGSAGIGGGLESVGGTFEISGGIITATGCDGGAGIGGGWRGAGDVIEITGGTVFAQGGYRHGGADIGPGGSGAASGSNSFAGGTIRLAGSSVAPAPTNGTASVACAVVTGFEPDALVVIEGLPYGYGVNDIFADDVGCIYLWLPDGVYTFTANGRDCKVMILNGVGPTGVTVNGEEVAFPAVAPPVGWNYDAATRTLSLSGAGPFTLSGVNVVGGVRVVVPEGVANEITLSDLTLRMAGDYQCAFALETNAIVSLFLAGSNVLGSGTYRAGLEVMAGRALSITNAPGEDEAGALTATGGNHAAGIGGGFRRAGGTVIFTGGSVTGIGGGGSAMSTGGDGGAGIGGGDGGAGGTAIVTGGRITAMGGGKRSAGIGGGYDAAGGTVEISGGTVFAQGSVGGADIGPGGYGTASGSNIFTGGSIFLANDTILPAPSNGWDRVWCVTVPDLEPGAAIVLTGLAAHGYGVNDLFADDSGKLYLWLPDGSYIITAGDTDYMATVGGAATTAVGFDAPVFATDGTALVFNGALLSIKITNAKAGIMYTLYAADTPGGPWALVQVVLAEEDGGLVFEGISATSAKRFFKVAASTGSPQ